MSDVTREQIAQYRRVLLAPESIQTEAACAGAVDRLGFLWAFTPGTGELPALFDAMPAHRQWDLAWAWKDRLSASRRCFYGRLVKGKPTLCSLQWLPAFYALTGNTGDIDEDLDRASAHGRIGEAARRVVLFLKENGPTGTRTLQKDLTDGSKAMRRALDKALSELDTALLIAKCGAEGGNSIANVWDLFPRFLAQQAEEGAGIATREGAFLLVRHYFTLTPAAPSAALMRLFPWGPEHVQRAIARLVEAGELIECRVEGREGLRRADWP